MKIGRSLKAILVLAGALFLFFSPVSSKADTIIRPDTTPEWAQTYSPPSEPSAAEIAAWVGYDGTLQWLYKQNVGGPESGIYANSYQTAFNNTPTDPSDAEITYVGGPYISGSPLYLLIKDGNHTPTLYIFALHNINTPNYPADSWDGTENILMSGFWPNQGAISNVAILGPTAVPEPGILILLGIGMTAVGIASRRMRKI